MPQRSGNRGRVGQTRNCAGPAWTPAVVAVESHQNAQNGRTTLPETVFLLRSLRLWYPDFSNREIIH